MNNVRDYFDRRLRLLSRAHVARWKHYVNMMQAGHPDDDLLTRLLADSDVSLARVNECRIIANAVNKRLKRQP